MLYRGCFYYTGINTSRTDSESTENETSRTRYLIRNQDQLEWNGVDPNPWVRSHEFMVFGISTAGVNTPVIRAPPVYARMGENGGSNRDDGWSLAPTTAAEAPTAGTTAWAAAGGHPGFF